jgi:hypothetical protein
MNLPHYFMADLPAEAELTPGILRQACETLRRNREQYLARRSVTSIIKLLTEVAENWLRVDFRFRLLALEHGPRTTGFSAPTIAQGIDSFFRQVTIENMENWIEQDLGDLRRLETMTATSPEDKSGRASIAIAPNLVAHITAGAIPCSAWQSMVLGVVLRSAQFIKCSTGTSLLPRLFAHSLYDADSKLGACLELAEWRGGNAALEDELLGQADCITASGSDETISSIRGRVGIKSRFVPYGHRISFAYISGGVLTGLNSRKVISRAADDVVSWDQLGCLSPHVIYVEESTGMSAEQFAEALAQELATRETTHPRGPVSVETSATIASRRAFYELRTAESRRSAEVPVTRLWCSQSSTTWTVVYEADPLFQLSCLHRFIYVKIANNIEGTLRHADAVHGKVSTVGLAAPEEKAEELATQFARWGVTRVCPLGQMQNPPLAWRHDGRPALADLVQWTDWEMGG